MTGWNFLYKCGGLHILEYDIYFGWNIRRCYIKYYGWGKEMPLYSEVKKIPYMLNFRKCQIIFDTFTEWLKHFSPSIKFLKKMVPKQQIIICQK